MGKVELHLEVDSELLARAEARGLSLDGVLERGLKAELSEPEALSAPDLASEAAARAWAEENAEAIEAYRRRLDERGVFGRDLRRW